MQAAVDERYRGIGIRIEDDILVTAGGGDNLTRDIPKQVADLEAHLAQR
jgi:Xaa-Pro aminopeptidase